MLPLPARPSPELQRHLLRDAFPLHLVFHPIRSGALPRLASRPSSASAEAQSSQHAWSATARTRPATAGPLSRPCPAGLHNPQPKAGATARPPRARNTSQRSLAPGQLPGQIGAPGERRGRVSLTGAAPSAALAARAFQPQQAASLLAPEARSQPRAARHTLQRE